jgi:hypothetical protein
MLAWLMLCAAAAVCCCCCCWQAIPEAIPLDVVFEDEHLIVVNKVRSKRASACSAWAASNAATLHDSSCVAAK